MAMTPKEVRDMMHDELYEIGLTAFTREEQDKIDALVEAQKKAHDDLRRFPEKSPHEKAVDARRRLYESTRDLTEIFVSRLPF